MRGLVAALVGAALLGPVAHAADATTATKSERPNRVTADRVAVRFYSPETGGSSRPRFVSERTLAFETRLEAMGEEGASSATYPDRFVRAALERHVAEEILAALMVEAGTEPPELPKLTADARQGLVERIGSAAIEAAQAAEGIDDAELEGLLRRRVRAAYYLDRSGSPVLHASDEQLREVYRTSAHPFKSLAFEEAKGPLARWFLAERLRIAENAFLQSARARVKIVVVPK